MSTDNRTNEPDKYSGFLARQNHQRDRWRGIGAKCLCGKVFDLDADHALHQVDEILRAALVAAQGAAPQAEGDERIQAWELLVEHPVWRSCFGEERPLIDSMMERIDKLAELEMTVNELAPAPVLPSSGVDEDKLAEVERAAAARAWEEGFLLSTRNSPTQPHPLLARNPYRKENSMAAEIREGN